MQTRRNIGLFVKTKKCYWILLQTSFLLNLPTDLFPWPTFSFWCWYFSINFMEINTRIKTLIYSNTIVLILKQGRYHKRLCRSKTLPCIYLWLLNHFLLTKIRPHLPLLKLRGWQDRNVHTKVNKGDNWHVPSRQRVLVPRYQSARSWLRRNGVWATRCCFTSGLSLSHPG